MYVCPLFVVPRRIFVYVNRSFHDPRTRSEKNWIYAVARCLADLVYLTCLTG